MTMSKRFYEKLLFDVMSKDSEEPLAQKVKAAFDPYLDAAIAKWRSEVFVEHDPVNEPDVLKLRVLVRPKRPAQSINISFTLEPLAPPEPSIVDRMAALEDREAAWRCIEYDRWAEERAARESAKTQA